jgi:hypothetical protein
MNKKYPESCYTSSMLWRRLRGLSFLEMVMALGLMFIGAGGVMSVLVAGAAWPTRLQQGATRDALAKASLDVATASGAVPVAHPFQPIPSHPQYELQTVVTPASFDSGASVVEVTVRGPMPKVLTESRLRGLHCQPSGAQLFTQYQCNTCHATGSGAALSAPTLNTASMEASRNAQNSAQGLSLSMDEYIERSIRVPGEYVVSGYTALMTGYPDIHDMPAEDLNALRSYLKTL